MDKIDETLAQHQHYKQECNVPNRSIFCRDNLDILCGINNECIDLIYLDPPFNKKKSFTAPIGSSAEGTSFKDIFYQEDLKDEWLKTIEEDRYEIHELLSAVKRIEGKKSYNFCYLAYMAIRLIEMHRVLKNTGSLYLHCDPTMSHYLNLLLDCIFGEKNFRNEIVWNYRKYSQAAVKRAHFELCYDTIFCYVKSKDANMKYTPQYIKATIPIKYRDNRTPSAEGFSFDERGFFKTAPTGYGKGGYSDETISRMDKEGLIHWTKNNIPRKKYYRKHDQEFVYDEKMLGNCWNDIPDMMHASTNELTGYPTQKPLALLERIVSASSNEGDVVLDPFCGCATTCVAAEKQKRHWIGIDISHKAYELVQERLKQEVWNDPDALQKYKDGYPDINYSVSPPRRTDSGAYSVNAKYIYVIAHPKYPDEYKVGIARTPRSRLNQYQTGDPERSYKIVYEKRVANYRQLEQHIHTTFPNKHEWVHGDLQEIIAEIEKNAITQSDDGEV